MLATRLDGHTYIFTDWVFHSFSIVRSRAEDPVILVLNDRYLQIRSTDAINTGRENYVAIVCLPPHNFQKTQPFNVILMGPLETYNAQKAEQWIRRNPGRVVTVYQIDRAYMTTEADCLLDCSAV
jgi:hypothetical protein